MQPKFDTNDIEINMTGTNIAARFDCHNAAAGMGGTFQYATLVIEQTVLGGQNDMKLGELRVVLSRHDAERLVRTLARSLQDQPAEEFAGIRPRGHGE